MDRGDIILAYQNTARSKSMARNEYGIYAFTAESLAEFANLVAAAEREACAAVCCDMIDAEYKTGKVDHNEMAWTQACVNAIRARVET